MVAEKCWCGDRRGRTGRRVRAVLAPTWWPGSGPAAPRDPATDEVRRPEKRGSGLGKRTSAKRGIAGQPGQQQPPGPDWGPLLNRSPRIRQELGGTQTARAATARRETRQDAAGRAPAARGEPRITTRKGFEVTGGENLPPVFTCVPMKDRKVVFTIDDGAEKDPELRRMMSEFQIPYSAFLTDYVISDEYGYFKRCRGAGELDLYNHTLNHRYLPDPS